MKLPPLVLAALLPIALFEDRATAQQRSLDTQTAEGQMFGVLLDTSTEPVGAASIVLRYASDTARVAGRAMSATDGRFRISALEGGRYLLNITHLGYATRTDSVALQSGQNLDLGVLRLETAPVQLQALEATAERSTVIIAADRTIYRTSGLAIAAAGSTTEMLRTVPELDVDLDGNVSLRGQSVAIHINGRPSAMKGQALTEFLRQLPAARVDRVEVIPNPSARFDAQGSGGIVNIVFRDDVQLGLSGSVGLTGGTRNSNGANGRVAYQRGIVTVFAGGSLNLYRFRSDLFDHRENLLTVPVTTVTQESRFLNDGQFLSYDATVEVKPSKRTGFWYSVNSYGSGGDTDILATYSIRDPLEALRDRYDLATLADMSFRWTDMAIGVKRTIKPGEHELTADVRMQLNRSANNGNHLKSWLQPFDSADEQRTNSQLTDSRQYDLQIDYTRPLGNARKLEVGLKTLLHDTDESYMLELVRSAGLSQIDAIYAQTEHFNTAYLTVSQTRGKLQLQLGARAEFADTELKVTATGERFPHDYQSLFPTLNASYTIATGALLRVSYSKRYERPWLGMLLPFVPSADEQSRSAGNPYIIPKYTHNASVELSRTGTAGSVRLSAFNRLTMHNWTRLRNVDSAGSVVNTWANVDSNSERGVAVTASMKPTARFGGSAGITVVRDIRDAANLDAAWSGATWLVSGNLNGNLRVNSSLSLQPNIRILPPRVLPQGRMTGGVYSSLGARQQLFNNKISISAHVNDPLNLAQFTFETRDRTHVQTSKTSFRVRGATLNISYNFGKPPEQISRRRENDQPQSDAPPIR